MEETRSSAERGPVTFEHRARLRRGLGRVMAAAKALGAGEIAAARHEIAEVRSLDDVFASDVMGALDQIGESLQQGQTRRAAAELQTVAAAMREELSRCAAAPGDDAPQPAVVPPLEPEPAPLDPKTTAPPDLDPETALPNRIGPRWFRPDAARALALAQLIGTSDAAPRPAVPPTGEGARTVPPLEPETARPDPEAARLEPETAPLDLDLDLDLETAPVDPETAPLDPEIAAAIAIAPPQSFLPDPDRALALAQLIGKAESPHTKRGTRQVRATYVIAAGMAGAILLVRATDWRTFFDAPRQPQATVTQTTTARTSGNAPAPPAVAQTPAPPAVAQTPAPPAVAQTPTRETDVPIGLSTRGTLPPPKQRHDVASRAIDVTDAAGTERRVVTERPEPVSNVQRPAAPPRSPEPPEIPRAPVEELPIAPARIEPPSTAPADASASPTAPSDVVQIERALGQYRQAYEGLDARGARAVWPRVNEPALARAFAGLESQGLVFDRCDVNVGDGSATAVCSGSARFVAKVGSKQPQVEPRRWTFSLRKSANGWEIENVETGRR